MHYLVLFFGQAIAYLILVVNLRALNRGKYLYTGVTEFVYALVNFFMIHKIVEARSFAETLAYACGATVGSLGAMWITKHWEK